jgi:hypothetical protein
MAVYSFSTSEKETNNDDKTVQAVKEYCYKHKIIFSKVVIEQLAKWLEEQSNA